MTVTPVALWHMDELVDTDPYVDSVAGLYTLGLGEDFATPVPGKLNGARQLGGTGTTGIASTAMLPLLFAGDWTIAFWVKPDSSSGAVLCATDFAGVSPVNAALIQMVSGQLQVSGASQGAGVVASAASVPAGTWARFLVTRRVTGPSSQTLTVYLNGAVDSSQVVSFAAPSFSGSDFTTLFLGGGVGVVGSLSGTLDEVQVSSGVASPTEAWLDFFNAGGDFFNVGSAVPRPQDFPCPVTALSEQDFLDMFDRIFPQSWIGPLKSPGPGYELLQAFAAVGARLSQAVANTGCDLFVGTANRGSLATGAVSVSRPAANTQDVTLKAGTVVRALRGQRDFVTTQDLLIPAASVGPLSVPVAAIARGYEWNRPGQATAADGTVLPGEIDSIWTLVEDPPAADLTLQVSQLDPTTGGRDPALEQLAMDVGLAAQGGESVEHLRQRIRALPDTVSPGALRRFLATDLSPYGVTATFIETWSLSYQTAWDAPDGPAGDGYDPTLFVYDDPRSMNPFQNVWLDEIEMRGFVIIVVPQLLPLDDSGMAYDDPANVSETVGRAVSTWDPPDALTAPELGAYDGYDGGASQVLGALFDQLGRVLAGGVGFAIVTPIG